MGLEGIIAVVALLVGVIALARGARRQEDEARDAPSTSPTSPAAKTDARLAQQVTSLEAQLSALRDQVSEQAELLVALVTEDEARHLWHLEKGEAVTYDSHPGLEQELRSLTRRGLIEKQGDFKIHELASPFNLVESFRLTDLGRNLLRRRSHLELEDTAPSDSLPPGR